MASSSSRSSGSSSDRVGLHVVGQTTLIHQVTTTSDGSTTFKPVLTIQTVVSGIDLIQLDYLVESGKVSRIGDLASIVLTEYIQFKVPYFRAGKCDFSIPIPNDDESARMHKYVGIFVHISECLQLTSAKIIDYASTALGDYFGSDKIMHPSKSAVSSNLSVWDSKFRKQMKEFSGISDHAISSIPTVSTVPTILVISYL